MRKRAVVVSSLLVAAIAGRVSAETSAAGVLTVDGPLTTDEIQSRFRGDEQHLRECAQQAAAGRFGGPLGAESGSFVLVVDVRPDGTVSSVRIAESTMGTPGFARCTARRVRSFRFPEKSAPSRLFYRVVLLNE